MCIHQTDILTMSSFSSLTGGSVRNGEKLQIQLFTDTHVGNAIPTKAQKMNNTTLHLNFYRL